MNKPDWLEARIELLRLQERMARLEEHVEKHERRDIESCERCDTDFYDVRSQLDRHVEIWAATWAKQAWELYGQKVLLVRVLQVLQLELSERIDGDNPRWDVWLTDQIRGLQKALRTVGVGPYSEELRIKP